MTPGSGFVQLSCMEFFFDEKSEASEMFVLTYPGEKRLGLNGAGLFNLQKLRVV